MKTGDKLPNGATVVHTTENWLECIVLARFHGPQEWVTWTYKRGRPESTGAGHYHDRLADAVADYEARGGRA